MDRFYTPTKVAERMVQSVTCSSVSFVADFAVGDGELLKAAETRWPEATFIATDINSSAVARLRKLEKNWRIGQCDFLRTVSRARCKILTKLEENISLILLNPPFSCRGACRYQVLIKGAEVYN